MEIILNNNIESFKSQNKLDILNKWIEEIKFDKNLIHSIIFIADKSLYGTTMPNIVNGTINFIIEISDDIVPYICEVQDETDKFIAKSVFQHEIFHFKEILFLYNSNLLPTPNPINDDFPMNTTYNYLYDSAIKLWSEFYACYENYKINPWHEIPNIEIDVNILNKCIIYLSDSIIKYKEIKMHKEILQYSYTLWYHMVSLMAVYMQNKEPLLLKEFQDCYSDYPYTEEYFKSIYGYLLNMIEHYPNWISEDNYIEFGKKLLSIFEINGITYSTNDLSNNFIFKKKE